MKSLPLFSIIVSFVGTVICAFSKKKAARFVNLIVSSIVLTLSIITLVYCYKENQSFIYTMGHFGPEEIDGIADIRLCNEIRFGVLECFLAAFFSFIFILVNTTGQIWINKDISDKKGNYFYVMLCLSLVAFISLVYTNDIFTGYVFLEISTLSSCGILAIKEKGKTILAAIRYMVFNLVGSGLFLIGITMLYDLTGYLSIENIAAYLTSLDTLNSAHIVCFSLICVGLSIKSGLFPFHFWMADAYGESTPPASSVLSGIVSKGYILLLIKVIYRMFTIEVISKTPLLTILFVFGVIAMVAGSINAIHQENIDKMIAFSSAAQIGYIFMGIGMGYEVALIAAIFHILTHAVTKPLLFLSGGHLIMVFDDQKKFRHLRGAGRVDVLSGIAFTCGAFSMVGIPLFAGFISKYYFVKAAVEIDPSEKWMMVVAIIALVISTVLNAIYFVRTVITIYLPVEVEKKRIKKYNVSYVIGIVAFVALNVYLGLGSDFIIDLITRGIDMFITLIGG